MSQQLHEFYCVLTSYYDTGLILSNIVQTIMAPRCPKCGVKEMKGKTIFLNWYEDKSHAEKAVEKARNEYVRGSWKSI